uniref:Phosphate transporter n=1 Tax=Lotharella oceanica TaxID=641309 RepID=A0A7S2TUK9_9EUKA
MTEALLYLSGLTGFLMAWAIGAQDVSNALGTCVGSKAITIPQAIVIGGVFEFLGSLMGGDVAHTISKGMVHSKAIESNVELYVLLMFCTLLGTFCWLAFATYFSLPVSTTHSLVGSILGLGIVTYPVKDLNTFTLMRILTSWVTSPLLGFVISYSIFFVIHRRILTRPQPEREAMRYLPYFYGFTLGILTLFMCRAGPQAFRTTLLRASAVCFMVCIIVGGLVHMRLKQARDKVGTPKAKSMGLQSINLGPVTDNPLTAKEYSDDDVEDTRTSNAEAHFSGLMILTACVVAFAHGSNDISNAIGPFSVIMEASMDGHISANKPIPKWVLVCGGVGIVVGLATYGHRVMATVGEKITKLTFTRGFAAQIGTALTVLSATIMGLSVSTTHCLIGAIAGVAMVESVSKINTGTLKKIALSWVVTMPASALCSLASLWITYLVLDPELRPH